MLFNSQEGFAAKALDFDTHESLRPDKSLSYMLNGTVSGMGGNDMMVVENAMSNSLCYKFPTDYELLGKEYVGRGQYVLFFLTRGNTESSEIGVLDTNTCTYIPKINNSCLNFTGPIKATYKTLAGCDSRRVYYVQTSGNKPVRFIDIDECLPVKDQSDCFDCNKDLVFDCDAFNLNKSVRFPDLSLKEGVGNLPNGVYQIAIALTDDKQRFTEYRVYPELLRFHTNNQGNNRFGIEVKFETCPQGFDQYELVLISHRTDRGTLAQRIGYFDVEQTAVFISELDSTTYTPIDLSILGEVFPHYQSASGIAQNNEELILTGVKYREKPNYQPRANKIRSHWVVFQVKAEDAHKFPSFMRGEVYKFEIEGVYKDGELTPKFHIPCDGELSMELIEEGSWAAAGANADSSDQCFMEGGCNTHTLKKWEAYDTTAIDDGVISVGDIPCEGFVVQSGTFGRWESSLQYPNNPCVWGQRTDPEADYYDPYGLSCQKVRYHKFPDCKTTHIHTNAECSDQEFVNILGVAFSNITPIVDKNGTPLKDIVGYQISVTDRSGNKSIIHKGIINNMFEEKLADCSTSYYANYPFNDLNADPFLSKTFAHHPVSPLIDVGPFTEQGFSPVDTYSRNRFTYISPDVSYERNDAGTYIQVCSEETGPVAGKYTYTDEMPPVVVLSDLSYTVTTGVIAAAALLLDLDGALNAGQNTLNAMLNTFRPVQYAANYYAKARYNSANFTNVSEGNTIRNINISQYLLPTKMLVGANKVNNFQRESALFMELCADLLDPSVTERSRIRYSDNFCKNQFGFCEMTNFEEMPTVSSYYVATKVLRPDQYGLPDVGVSRRISKVYTWDNLSTTHTGLILGGDIFITKHKQIRKFPFFTNLPLNVPPKTEYQTRPYFNVWQTRYWFDPGNAASALLLAPFNVAIEFAYQENDNRNLEKTGSFAKIMCEESNTSCDKDYFFRVDGSFYTHVIGEMEYWCESEYIGNFRELNEIPQSDIERPEEEKIRYTTVQYPELFLYNRQYHWKGFSPYNIPADINLDCCKPETICSMNTLAYSLKHDPLRKGDAWLKFLPLSVQQFSSKDGDLVGVKAIDNYNLLLFFEDGTYVTQQDEYITTDSGNKAYLGTPDAFSRRMRKISDESTGFGGCMDLDSVVSTPDGVFWFDRKRHSFVQFIGGQIYPADDRMRSWMQQFAGGNVSGVYDAYTKTIFWTGDSLDAKGGVKCSWTLSFYPSTKDWVSFHSFLPEHWLQVPNGFLTADQTGIWKHNSPNGNKAFQTYYGKEYPFIIGMLLKQGMTDGTLQSIEVYSEWDEWTDGSTGGAHGCKKFTPGEFFDQMLVYNNLAMTDVKDIVVKNDNDVQHIGLQNRHSNLVEASYMDDFTHRINKFEVDSVYQPGPCVECGDMIIPPVKKLGNVSNHPPIRGKWVKINFTNNKPTHRVKMLVATAQHDSVSK